MAVGTERQGTLEQAFERADQALEDHLRRLEADGVSPRLTGALRLTKRRVNAHHAALKAAGRDPSTDPTFQALKRRLDLDHNRVEAAADLLSVQPQYRRMYEQQPNGSIYRDPVVREAVYGRADASLVVCGTRRESHRGRPGHRRTRSTRAGPSSSDDPPAEGPALALAPSPKTIYHYAASHCPSCGAVLLWSDGRLICCRRSCSRWGRPA